MTARRPSMYPGSGGLLRRFAGIFIAGLCAMGLLCETQAAPPEKAPPPLSEPAPPCDDGSLEIVARIPSAVDAVIVCQDLSSIVKVVKQTPLAMLLASSGALKGTSAAFDHLAQQLGWTPEEALERLIGTRSVLVLGNIRSGTMPRWGLLSTVDPETEKRLRRTLDAAPRDIVAGRPVLSLENGAYLLAASVITQNGPDGKPQGTTSLMLLAPAGDSGLFQALLPVLSGDAPSPLRTSVAFSKSSEVGLGHLGLLLRLESEGQPWSAFVALGVEQHADSARGRVFVRSPKFNAIVRDVPVSSGAFFEAAQQGSILAIVEPHLIEGTTAPSVMVPLLAANAPSVSKGVQGGSINALVVRALPDGAPQSDVDRVSVTLAQSVMLGGHAAADADEVGDSLVERLESSRAASAANTAAPAIGSAELAGAAPLALRRVEVSVSKREPLRSLVGDQAQVAWRLVPVSGGPVRLGESAPGWRLLSLAPAPRELTATAAAELFGGLEGVVPSIPPRLDAAAQDARRWLSQGLARPALLRQKVAMLRSSPLDALVGSLLSELDSIRWNFWLEDAADVRGVIDVRTVPPEP